MLDLREAERAVEEEVVLQLQAARQRTQMDRGAMNHPNVYEAQGDGSFVYSEPVWWAGGTRSTRSYYIVLIKRGLTVV